MGALLISRVDERFERQAKATPSAPALVFRDDVITYGELNARANRLARVLREAGVGTESLVGVLLARGIDCIVTFLAVWKAGGAYVPISTDLPDARIATILDDAAPTIVVTDLRERVPAALAIVAPASTGDDTDLEVARDPRALAYVIYTSGSTGTPKGVLVEHAGVSNYGEDVVRRWKLRAGDRVLGFAPFSFDSSIADIVGSLTSGATLVIRPPEILGGDALAELLVRAEITHALLPPAVWSSLPEVVLPALRTAITAGDSCGDAVVDRWGRGRMLVNEYGPTEGTVCATSAVCTPGTSATIGRPIAGVRVYVLDDALEPVERDERGELYIAGAGVARGYANQPARTAERFLPDPFSSEPGARMYRTGDLARRGAGDNLEFLGRVDHQVKIRGFRIELEEIEVQLRRHPAVRDAVVVAREDSPGDKRLVAYVVGNAPIAELRAHLASTLPEYMVPAAYVTLASLPLTPHAKVDRKAPPPPGPDAFVHGEYAAPRGDVEEALARMMAALLQTARVGRDDDFFALGGHSLLAVQLVARIGRELDAMLPLDEVFRYPTIAGMATRIRTAPRPHAAVKRLGLPEGPATLLQPYFCAMHQIYPEMRLPMVIPELWRLRGPLDEAAVAGAIVALGARHEILRTSFVKHGELRQVVRPAPLACAMERRDETELADAITSFVKPLALDRDPLAKFQLIRIAPDDHALMMLIAHIAYDAGSSMLLRRELAEGYRGVARDPLPFQMLDVAAHITAYRSSTAGRADLEYWTRQLADLQPLQLPTDSPRDEVDRERATTHAATGIHNLTHFTSANVTQPSDAALADLVTATARRESVPLIVCFLAGLAELLHAETGQTDLVVMTSLDIRPWLGAEALVGGFNSPILIRIDLASCTTHRAVLHHIRETFSQGYSRALISPNEIAPAFVGRVNLGFSAVRDLSFQLGDAVGTPLAGPAMTTDVFDLRPNIVVGERHLGITFGYNPRLFRPETITRLCSRYVRVLRAIGEDPAGKLT